MGVTLETVLVSFDPDDGIGRITLNRPEQLSTVSDQLARDLATALDALAAEDRQADRATVRAVTIDGAGDRAFCAGADIGEFSDRVANRFHPRPHYEAFESFPAPVVAMIDGTASAAGSRSHWPATSASPACGAISGSRRSTWESSRPGAGFST